MKTPRGSWTTLHRNWFLAVDEHRQWPTPIPAPCMHFMYPAQKKLKESSNSSHQELWGCSYPPSSHGQLQLGFLALECRHMRLLCWLNIGTDIPWWCILVMQQWWSWTRVVHFWATWAPLWDPVSNSKMNQKTQCVHTSLWHPLCWVLAACLLISNTVRLDIIS